MRNYIKCLFPLPGKGVRLECNEECSQLERNRRMAVALQIENPDVTNRVNGPPRYSDFVKDFAKREPFFARAVHDSLAQLVAKTKESNNFKHRVHEFDCMGREKRQFVHELAAHFGCTTQVKKEKKPRILILILLGLFSLHFKLHWFH